MEEAITEIDYLVNCLNDPTTSLASRQRSLNELVEYSTNPDLHKHLLGSTVFDAVVDSNRYGITTSSNAASITTFILNLSTNPSFEIDSAMKATPHLLNTLSNFCSIAPTDVRDAAALVLYNLAAKEFLVPSCTPGLVRKLADYWLNEEREAITKEGRKNAGKALIELLKSNVDATAAALAEVDEVALKIINLATNFEEDDEDGMFLRSVAFEVLGFLVGVKAKTSRAVMEKLADERVLEVVVETIKDRDQLVPSCVFVIWKLCQRLTKNEFRAVVKSEPELEEELRKIASEDHGLWGEEEEEEEEEDEILEKRLEEIVKILD